MSNKPNKPSLKRRLNALTRNQRLVDPRIFLSPRRLDLAAKTVYARAVVEGNPSDWPEYVYREHIRAFNNFYEADPPKSSYYDFKDSFLRTIGGAREDNWKHAAPVLKNKDYLMNGAHRVAASMALNDHVNAKTPKKVYLDNYNYELFGSDRPSIPAIDEHVLDYMTVEYVSLKRSNIFVAVVFPSAEGYRQEAYDHFLKLGEIVNMRTFKHDEFHSHEVVKQLYCNNKNDEWNHGLSLEGSKYKGGLCFDGTGDLQVYVIEANLDESSRIKEKQYLRDLWKKDKHSIHITDTIEEANRVVRMFFNENSRRFMKINRKQEFHSQVMYGLFEEYMSKSPKDVFELENVAVEGSAVLDLLNIRSGKDIDYISRRAVQINSANIEEHGPEENKYNGTSIDNILTDPQHYFYYKGYKFVDILQIRKFKLNRSKNKDQKDIKDLKMIDKFLANNPQYVGWPKRPASR